LVIETLRAVECVGTCRLLLTAGRFDSVAGGCTEAALLMQANSENRGDTSHRDAKRSIDRTSTPTVKFTPAPANRKPVMQKCEGGNGGLKRLAGSHHYLSTAPIWGERKVGQHVDRDL
jgi:hypothetical protein